MQRSLACGMNVQKVLDLAAQIRPKTDAALILFSYLNPIQKDLKGFVHKAKKAGVDGFLIVDLPFEESAEFRALCQAHDLALITVAAPSTPPQRIASLTAQSSGFLYYACRKGTTGARNALPDDLVAKLQELRAHSSLPIAIGFGIADRKSAAEVLRYADGCVVGSYFVTAIEKDCTPQELEHLAKEIFVC